MDEGNLTFQVNYQGKSYSFSEGSQVFIFHYGVMNGMVRKYGMDTLFEYIELVHRCYLKDCNPTPLGNLADYIAENWKRVKKRPCSDILIDFYCNLD